MSNTGLLVLTKPIKVAKLLPVIKERVLKTLYIQYFPGKNALLPGSQSLSSIQWKGPRYNQTVSHIYALASTDCSCLDVRVLLTSLKNPSIPIIHTKKPVEIVIFDQTYSNNEANTFIQDCLSNTSMGCTFVTFDDEKVQELSDDKTEYISEDPTYRNVVLGGTFDRLHNGHKSFLSEAALLCTEKLTIGVTETNMLLDKTLWELIEPCSKRIANLKDFLEDVDTSLTYNIVPITDMYGPTKDDPTLEMIVVSEETKRGADKINRLRSEKGLNKLKIHVVKLMSDVHHKEHEEPKISSSNHRMRLLGTRIQDPRIDGKPLRPYIIGLTGGIGSGKSSVAEKLQKLGAGLVNCDQIAHDLYNPGNRCFDSIVECFGSAILNPRGFINRKVLGKIVFNDREQLDKLNNLVWPVILEQAQKQIKELYKYGFNIIIMEAAVLIQAGWQHVCHEIWTCIIPPEEAIKRVAQRNVISEVEAKLRVQAQPSNSEQVEEANVVVCTMWSHEITQQQVQKAWDQLLEYLAKHPESQSD